MTTVECPKRVVKPRRRSRLSSVLLTTGVSLLAQLSSAFQLFTRPAAFPFHSPTFFWNRCSVQALVLYALSDDEAPSMPQSNKKKRSFTINPNLSAFISSDGIVSDRRKDRPVASSSLGVPSKKKPQKSNTSSKSMTKEDRQRTANGAVDSSRQTLIACPEREHVQILEAKRGTKTVTIVRGMTSPMEDRKNLLKMIKRCLGVGGTLVDGVLEIQGPHANKVLATLQQEGYAKAKRIGK